ncbi:MAG: hypothetical protein RIE24_00505 [Silicimonas sp.]|jgi:hypothetical protein|uniref:hypothetical protein n=1 Tax=Roseitalea porphyridii TaxID=1852022 RepID=UPI0032EB310C
MAGWWTWITTTFDNREIATGFWLSAAFLLSLFHSKIRSGLVDVIKALVNWKLLLLFGSYAVYVAILAWLLGQIGLWKSDQTAATVIWYLLSGAVMLGRSLQSGEDQNFFRNTFLDSFRLTVVFEFVVVAYAFSLPVELVFVPFVTVLGALLAVAGTQDDYRPVKRLLEGLLALIVLVLVWHSVSAIWAQPEGFFTFATGRNFLLPLLLTTLSIPAFYLWHCFSEIEHANIRIDQKNFQSDELKRYARKRFLLRFALRPELLRRAVRQFQTMPATTESDVDAIITEIMRHERQSKNPGTVDEADGWSPYLARDFMSAEGLRTGDYHRGYEGGEWWASSSIVELDTQLLPNTVTFFIEGDEGVVRVLKLKGHFMDEFDPKDAVERFKELAEKLAATAVPKEASEIADAIQSGDAFDMNASVTKASWMREQFPNDKGFNLYFILRRG